MDIVRKLKGNKNSTDWNGFDMFLIKTLLTVLLNLWIIFVTNP